MKARVGARAKLRMKVCIRVSQGQVRVGTGVW